MYKYIFYFLISVLFVFIGCANNQIYKPVHISASCQTQSIFIESYSSSQSLVRATGEGRDIQEVKKSAQRDALCFALTHGSIKLLDTPSKIDKFAPYAKEIEQNLSRYAHIKGREKSRREEDGIFIFEYIVEVDVANLKQDLSKYGIISSNNQLSSHIGIQTFRILKNKKTNSTTVSTIEKYLTKRKFQIADYKPSKNSIDDTMAVLTQIYGGESDFVDKNTANMLNSKADVIIETQTILSHNKTSGIQTAQAEVSLKAYESATRNLLASSQAFSPQRSKSNISPLVAEATHGAIDDLTRSISSKWEDYVQDGKPFRVLMVALEAQDFSLMDNDFYEALKSISEDVNEIHKGIVASDYAVVVKNTKKARDLFVKIKANYKGWGELHNSLSSNNFLLIKISESDFDIEVLE